MKVLKLNEIKIVDGTKYLDDVKRLVVEYTKFLGRNNPMDDVIYIKKELL